MDITREIKPSSIFDARHCERAKVMKDAGLPWTLQPGFYVFDQHDRINAHWLFQYGKRAFAMELLDLGKASYRLRDDDN